MNRIEKLGSIASITSGYTFREKINEVERGNAHVLQIKDAREQQERFGDNVIRVNEVTQLDWQGRDSHFAEKGIVVLPTRGDYSRASYIPEAKSDLPLIISSQFILIKPKISQVLPEFLCWILNRHRAQHYIREVGGQGTSMSLLNNATAKEILIELPPLDVQEKIININAAWEQERHITQALLNNREAMLQGIYQQLLKG